MKNERKGLSRKVELVHRSSERMLKSLGLTRDKNWWRFMRRELWIHLKRTVELMWAVVRKKSG